MHKPDCDCNEVLIKAIKEKNNISDNAHIYFREQNILNGALINYVLIEEKVTAKSGRTRTKTDHVPVIHNYCPFCGKIYKTE